MANIIIGHSDYSRQQIEAKNCGWTFGCDPTELLEVINFYESNGFIVKFKTNLLRRIFGLGIYKIVAYEKT